MISETYEAEKKPERVRQITGKTRVFGILADPIYHVKTPQTMNAVFDSHGLDCVLVPFHVAPAALPVLVEGLRRMQNFGGFIATVPHKPSMLDLCDEVTDAARHIGAVNCVRREDDGRLVGTMLDGIGFVEAMRARGVDVSGMKVFLVGAGGASSAIAFGLAEAGVNHITISNRSASRARELQERLSCIYPGLSLSIDAQDIEHHDVIINGSTLGMRSSDAEPVDFSRIHAEHLVADAIMEPAVTPLLAAAQSRGCEIFPGKPMLDSQIVLMAQHMGALPRT
ncbi:shikimate dehydrogenase family protein [Rhizobium ruizarguesonis]|uniref:shikimate dehydrogenase (NADP(+)) n=1 Tax=Rhizobium ruizarguesonis TaxID=2081791 RepID=A0AB38HZM7_9HYPH|nr:shikimate dehydrogenase [Rhizobium ruizarguesonis]TAU92827.1 shikimate dehydrogenase [Rhizobium ruizarguesonis]TBA74731.1 shikimate dehydrogenase [Rhizobium ruizarguesonis]TBB64534.1 shikimate dehydrogenase [Rhizobium ruizarguesonis]TBC07150.1 shikimate dehydrogenase [Rhizobium ruizarguesonis]WSH62026.1 shikimate dehydrogenase [Rhizobium ruizarguesonis]